MRSPRGFSELLFATLFVELLVGGIHRSNLTTALSWGVIIAVGAVLAVSILARNGVMLWRVGLIVLVGGYFYGSSLPSAQQTLWPWYAGAALIFALLLAFYEEVGKIFEGTLTIATNALRTAKTLADSVAAPAAAAE